MAPEPTTVEKTVNAYKVYNFENDYLDPDVSDPKYQLGTVSLRFKKGEELVPYISLENMAGLYSRFFKDPETTKSSVSKDGAKFTWKVTVADQEVFASTIDAQNKTFTYQGSLEGRMKPKQDYSAYSVFLRTKYESKITKTSSSHPVLVSYADTGLDALVDGDATYFPFSMLHTFYHELTEREFFYNYVYLYEYLSFENLNTANVTDGDDVYTPLSQMGDYVSAHYKTADVSGKPLMPAYARNHHRSEFALVMNHYYGLRSTWGVTSMMDYYKSFGLYDAFVSEDSAVRGAAYAKAIFMLGDSHSGRFPIGSNPWVEDNGNARVPGASADVKVVERSLLDQGLKAQREAFLKANGFDSIKDAIIYSEDGKTAYMGFDEFGMNKKAKKPDGTPKPDSELTADSYFYFVLKLQEIKAHRTTVGSDQVKVERVLIDDSLNGGGIVMVMGRLLALLSKDNRSAITAINELTGDLTTTTYQVDTNNDGVYDTNDVYGNDFKFYILTSPVSFSCGNAFPMLAQHYGIAKIIGQKSGGGECVVGENYLSSGTGFAHSSLEHVMIPGEEAGKFDHTEDGVQTDKRLNYNDFYNMTEMCKAMDALNA